MKKNEENKKPSIYLIDRKIKWETFKLLQDKLVKDSGPTPKHGDKMLWKMIKEKKIYAWFDPFIKGDMLIGLEIPKRKIILISTPQSK